ncbi:MauE/DoxX family redox-associated membrane protein [uncultured Serinicoccus sp.]|uniref:MauE/DoxX family redox-associated membrane protein n=1 Tax=uncultured Serinicoccus sp. TaxID=735514 RepID=UPI0026253CB7|nr:MauE/DoxX family redox-associated membrane protein [uncultured Serinicoccus sp.]
MPPALALTALPLALVLGLAGLAKLSAPGATADMVRALRLPGPLRPPVVERVLPWVELVSATLLLTPWSVTYAVGAASALALCLVFTAVVARALRTDPRPDCACFGRIGDHRITARTLVRNLLLVALGVGAAWAALGGRTAWGLLADFGASDWWWLGIALVTSATAALALGRPSAPPPDEAPVPTDEVRAGEVSWASAWSPGPVHADAAWSVPLVDRDLDVVTARTLAVTGPQVLVLVSCWCGPTFDVVGRLPRWRQDHPRTGIHLVHTEPPWSEPRVRDLGDVWWDPGARLHETWGEGARPTGVLLGADGLLAGPVTGVPEIERLLGYSANRSRTT